MYIVQRTGQAGHGKGRLQDMRKAAREFGHLQSIIYLYIFHVQYIQYSALLAAGEFCNSCSSNSCSAPGTHIRILRTWAHTVQYSMYNYCTYHRIKRWQNRKVWFLIHLHIKETLPRHIEESSSRFCVMQNFPRISQNSKLKISPKFREITRTKISQPPHVLVEWGGWGWAGTARTLCTNADCALSVFLFYCFPFCHLLILWYILYNVYTRWISKQTELHR